MSDSEGSFDNDTTVGSFLEDMIHFCGVLQKVLAGCPAAVEGPWGPCGMSIAEANEAMEKLKELEEKYGDEEKEMERDGEVAGWAEKVLPAFHVGLLNWHCLEFYPLHEKFTPEYNEYLKEFLKNIPKDYLETFLLQGEREYFLSAYSFSHRVKGVDQNSARVSYGVAYQTTPALTEKALAVFKAHNITLPDAFSDISPTGKFQFYGLGWDFGVSGDAHVKIYLHGEAADLPVDYQKKRAEAQETAITGEFSPHVLIAFTYTDKGAYLEDKLYLYPDSPSQVKDPTAIPSGTLNVAYVITSGELNRGEFWQLDVTHSPSPACEPIPEWRERLNAQGQAIYDKYHENGMRLDTLGYGSNDNFTLYFPFEP
eukprot:TRINITY_DN20971_c0_g1_i1.p1 TRINITY_DN20971_c0_g1~~TRINITY_DN20971_c0_g1_i1.p1  ORF type:complete len:369 (+),score=119.88 TRINITY_DN20971_c0_g1_i1:53-1159(+)